MATKAHRHIRRPRRAHNTSSRSQWLMALVARTLASLLLMVVAHWLHLPLPSGA
jgi:hypothetical protein